MSKASYIYGEFEYVLTGRSAVKKSKSGTKQMTLVEIRPSTAAAEDRSDNKWVKMEDLYHVVADENNDIIR